MMFRIRSRLNRETRRRAAGRRIAWLCSLLFVIAAAESWAAKPHCGDGRCSKSESVKSCAVDCSSLLPPEECNNDGVCNAGENCLGCSDCPGRISGQAQLRFCCGNDTCDTERCGADACAATPICGNYLVEYSEDCDEGPYGSLGCDLFCNFIDPVVSVPLNQFNVGDSIGEGEAANGTIGAANHQLVWSTGWDGVDPVLSLNERLEARDPSGYEENDAVRDPAFNQAISGSVMADFATQAASLASAMETVPPQTAGLVTVLLGNNDVCADSLAEMTDPAVFEQQYRAGLDVLANLPFEESLNLLISGIPDIYWLWNAKRGNLYCRLIAWPFVPCQNLLDDAADDCESSTSREDPDQVYPGDGPACQRRKTFHALIRDDYNTVLNDVLQEYQGKGRLLNAEYVDVFDIRFDSDHVNSGDCFHPSTAGHALLAEKQWCRSRWGEGDPGCAP
jgi:lysophospholipase L1-like esterase